MTKLYKMNWLETAYVYADNEDQAWSKVWDALVEAKKAGCYVESISRNKVEEDDNYGLGVETIERCVVCGEPVGATEVWDGHPVYEGKPYCNACIEEILKDELNNGIVARKYYPGFCSGFNKYTYVVKDKADLERQAPAGEDTIYVRVEDMVFYYCPKTSKGEEWWGGAYVLRGDKAKILAFLAEFPTLQSVRSKRGKK